MPARDSSRSRTSDLHSSHPSVPNAPSCTCVFECNVIKWRGRKPWLGETSNETYSESYVPCGSRDFAFRPSDAETVSYGSGSAAGSPRSSGERVKPDLFPWSASAPTQQHDASSSTPQDFCEALTRNSHPRNKRGEPGSSPLANHCVVSKARKRHALFRTTRTAKAVRSGLVQL